MAYPEPIPVLKGKDADEFLEKLENFELTDEQKEFYKYALEIGKCKDDCVGHYMFGHCIGCVRYPNMRDQYRKK